MLKKEAEITFEKLLELHNNPIILDFGEEHLRAIHQYLFEEIYKFAGEYRNVYMGKNNSYFASEEMISFRLKEAFRVAEEELKMVQYDYSGYGFAGVLTGLYIELLNIHPFREGNGRAIKEFIREYANEKSKQLGIGEINFSWNNVNTEEINLYIDKAIVFRSNIENEFMKAFEKVDKSSNYSK